MISPLQLLDYRSELLAYERLDAESPPDDLDMGVGLAIEFDTHFDEGRDAQCLDLVVDFNQEDGVPEEVQPYLIHRGRYRTVGWVRWIDDEVSAREDAHRLLMVNGLSMLFGITRVYVAELTSGSERRLVLPSVTFQTAVDDFLDTDDEGASEEA